MYNGLVLYSDEIYVKS